MEINRAKALKILNSNSNFTVRVVLNTDKGVFRGSSPAGESTSKYEVTPFGEEVDKEIGKFNDFLKTLIGKKMESMDDIYSLEKVMPEEFVGGPSLSLSYALLYGLSADKGVEPYELFGAKKNVIPVCKMMGGGMHASDLGMDIQEILVMTMSDKTQDSVESTLAVYKELKELLKQSTHSFLGGVDPEGGFISGLDNYESLKIVKKAVDRVIKNTGSDIRLGIDMAASTFFKDGKYTYKKPLYGKKEISKEEQIELVKRLESEFDLYYIEDPVDETLISDYGEVLKGSKALVVGDDVTATKVERLEKARGNINATLIKPNQVGLLYQVKEYSDLSDKLGLVKVVSHRSEETNTPIIADLALGLNAKYLKVGINRGERVEKINRLLETC